MWQTLACWIIHFYTCTCLHCTQNTCVCAFLSSQHFCWGSNRLLVFCRPAASAILWKFNLNVTFKGSIVKWRTIAHSTATLPQLLLTFACWPPCFFLTTFFSVGWKLPLTCLECQIRAVGETYNCLHFWHCYIKESVSVSSVREKISVWKSVMTIEQQDLSIRQEPLTIKGRRLMMGGSWSNVMLSYVKWGHGICT